MAIATPTPESPVKIFGKPLPDPRVCEFNIDRVVFPGKLAVHRNESVRWDRSDTPLLRRIFGVSAVESVFIESHRLIVSRTAESMEQPWPQIGRQVGDAIRATFAEGMVWPSDFGQAVVSAGGPGNTDGASAKGSELFSAIERLIDTEINPSLASHGGRAKLTKVELPRAYVEMAGGCQGCGMAAQTLRDGIRVALTRKFPEITDVVDVTDHAAGTNPYA